jgi:hypothetical protein
VAETAECPNPHEEIPGVVSDLPLKRLGGELAAWLDNDLGAGSDEAETRVRLRPYLDRLRELKCPPEYMLLHLKQLLMPIRPSSQAVTLEEYSAFVARRDAIISLAIREYFA